MFLIQHVAGCLRTSRKFFGGYRNHIWGIDDSDLHHCSQRGCDGKNYKLADEKSLLLYFTKARAKSWRFKYRFGDKEKLLTFGLFPEVGLTEARDRYFKARALLHDGIDPAVELERRRLTGDQSTFTARLCASGAGTNVAP